MLQWIIGLFNILRLTHTDSTDCAILCFYAKDTPHSAAKTTCIIVNRYIYGPVSQFLLRVYKQQQQPWLATSCHNIVMTIMIKLHEISIMFDTLSCHEIPELSSREGSCLTFKLGMRKTNRKRANRWEVCIVQNAMLMVRYIKCLTCQHIVSYCNIISSNEIPSKRWFSTDVTSDKARLAASKKHNKSTYQAQISWQHLLLLQRKRIIEARGWRCIKHGLKLGLPLPHV